MNVSCVGGTTPRKVSTGWQADAQKAARKRVTRRGLWIAFAIFLPTCGEAPSPPVPAPTVLPPGETLRLAPREIADMKAIAAEVTTRDEAAARARIAGTLSQLVVAAGDVVEKGERIGTIVDARLRYEANAAGAEVAAAEAEERGANADLARIRDLYANGVYAKARLDQAAAASGAAEARLAAARGRQAASDSIWAQGAVLAPASGRVLRADVPAGSVVAPGTSIATITAGPPILRLLLPETLAGRVRPGARVIVTDAALPGPPREASVAKIYPAVEDGRIRVDAVLPGLGTAFIGRRVGALVEIGRRTALVVPRRFVTTRYGIDSVQVVAPDRRLSSVVVQIAPADRPGNVEILSGVASGDTLFAPAAGT